MTALNRTPNEWHLDRRFSITLIVLLLGEFAALVWWDAGIQAYKEASEKALVSMTQSLVTVGETNVKTVRVLAEINGKLTRAEIDIVKLESRGIPAENAEPRISVLENEHRILFSQIQRQLGELNLALAQAIRGFSSENDKRP